MAEGNVARAYNALWAEHKRVRVAWMKILAQGDRACGVLKENGSADFRLILGGDNRQVMTWHIPPDRSRDRNDHD